MQYQHQQCTTVSHLRYARCYKGQQDTRSEAVSCDYVALIARQNATKDLEDTDIKKNLYIKLLTLMTKLATSIRLSPQCNYCHAEKYKTKE